MLAPVTNTLLLLTTSPAHSSGSLSGSYSRLRHRPGGEAQRPTNGPQFTRVLGTGRRSRSVRRVQAVQVDELDAEVPSRHGPKVAGEAAAAEQQQPTPVGSDTVPATQQATDMCQALQVAGADGLVT